MNRQGWRQRSKRESATAPRGQNGRVLAWILASFGFLVVGLAGGTALYAWRADLGWTVPLACFAAYLLAFRRGMVLWNPEIDRTWRDSLRVRPPAQSRKDAWNPEATLRLPRPDEEQPTGPPLRVVR